MNNGKKGKEPKNVNLKVNIALAGNIFTSLKHKSFYFPLFLHFKVLVILDNIASLFRDMELFDEALDVTAQADVISTRLLERADDKGA